MGRLTSSLFRQPKPSRVLALANLAYQDTTRSFGCANRPWTANAIHCAERGLLHGAICFFGVLGSDLYLAPSVVSQQVGVEVEGSWRFTCHSAEDKLMLCGSVVLHGPGIRCYFQMEVYESYTYEFMKWLMDTLLYHLAWEKLPLQLVEVWLPIATYQEKYWPSSSTLNPMVARMCESWLMRSWPKQAESFQKSHVRKLASVSIRAIICYDSLQLRVVMII